jgi:hypothetical protein
MSLASFSSARPAIRRACSSELRVPVVPFLGGSVARVAVVPRGHGPADALATLAVMTTDQKGAIAEACIAAAAVKLGIEVYRPIAEGSRYDLIFDLGRRLLRVQCKWAARRRQTVVVPCQTSRRTADGFVRRRYTAEEVDAVAAYCLDLDRCFLIPIARVAQRPAIALRIGPCLNNQRRRINWADDFDFAATLRHHQGAIAQLGERLHGMQEVAGSSPAGSIETRPR